MLLPLPTIVRSGPVWATACLEHRVAGRLPPFALSLVGQPQDLFLPHMSASLRYRDGFARPDVRHVVRGVPVGLGLVSYHRGVPVEVVQLVRRGLRVTSA